MNRDGDESFNQPKIRVNCTDRRSSNTSIAVSIKLGSRRRDSIQPVTRGQAKKRPPSATGKRDEPAATMKITRSQSRKAQLEHQDFDYTWLLKNEPLGKSPNKKQGELPVPRKSETIQSDITALFESLPRITALRQNSTVDSSKGADFANERNHDNQVDGIQAGQVMRDFGIEPQLKPIKSLQQPQHPFRSPMKHLDSLQKDYQRRTYSKIPSLQLPEQKQIVYDSNKQDGDDVTCKSQMRISAYLNGRQSPQSIRTIPSFTTDMVNRIVIKRERPNQDLRRSRSRSLSQDRGNGANNRLRRNPSRRQRDGSSSSFNTSQHSDYSSNTEGKQPSSRNQERSRRRTQVITSSWERRL